MLFNGSILALDAKGGGSNPPALTMLRIIDYPGKYPEHIVNMKKIQFTDSNNKDFEFWIYEELVRFYYIVEPKPRLKTVSADLRIKDIENNNFPENLKDFKEATTYLRKYIEHIAFI